MVSKSADLLFSILDRLGIQRSQCIKFVDQLKKEIKREIIEEINSNNQKPEKPH